MNKPEKISEDIIKGINGFPKPDVTTAYGFIARNQCWEEFNKWHEEGIKVLLQDILNVSRDKDKLQQQLDSLPDKAITAELLEACKEIRAMIACQFCADGTTEGIHADYMKTLVDIIEQAIAKAGDQK